MLKVEAPEPSQVFNLQPPPGLKVEAREHSQFSSVNRTVPPVLKVEAPEPSQVSTFNVQPSQAGGQWNSVSARELQLSTWGW